MVLADNGAATRIKAKNYLVADSRSRAKVVARLSLRNAEFCVLLPARQFTPMIEVRGQFETRPQDMEVFN